MATQRTRANLYKAGYKRTKAALQKQQKINAAMSTTLAAQNPTVTTQTITTTSPKVVQPKTIKTQVTQNPTTTTQVYRLQLRLELLGQEMCLIKRVGKVHRVPAGTTKTAYNLRSTPRLRWLQQRPRWHQLLRGRGGGGPQGVQINKNLLPRET